jgi:hypothetical protein
MISCFYVISTYVGCFAVIGLVVVLNYSLANFLVFRFSWIIIWSIWSYYANKADFYFPGYFFITCYHLKLRLSSTEKRLKNFMKYSKHSSMRSKISTISRLLRDHNNFCKQIDEYNQYWKKYLTLTYIIVLSVVLFIFILYFIFISPIKWFARIKFSLVLSAHLLLILRLLFRTSMK